jgi:hypothetical protein
LDVKEGQVCEQLADWLKMLETTALTKSYKMIVLRVLLDQQSFPAVSTWISLLASVEDICRIMRSCGKTFRETDMPLIMPCLTIPYGPSGGTNGQLIAGRSAGR